MSNTVAFLVLIKSFLPLEMETSVEDLTLIRKCYIKAVQAFMMIVAQCERHGLLI